MDEDIIDQRYEDEKQKALDEYSESLGNNKNHEKAEKVFNAKMDDITKRYNKLMMEHIGNKNKHNSFKDFINKVIDRTKFANRK